MRKAPLGSGQGEQGCPSPPRCDDEQLSARGCTDSRCPRGARHPLPAGFGAREVRTAREGRHPVCVHGGAGVGGQRSAEKLRA